MFEIKHKLFPNSGWLEIKLSKEILNHLNKAIKKKKQNYNHKLVGHIEGSYILEDKDNWFFKTVLLKCITEYISKFGGHVVPITFTRDCPYVLNSLWVNYQKKHQFNPVHHHTGAFSFVIWIKIPTSHKKESKVSFVKHANLTSASSFTFLYSNILGHLQYFEYKLEPQDEGTMLFFPSRLNHAVYPFYTSNKNRISISGNIAFNTSKIK
tara:strand:+ start:227 stop:856 length:630 start_codon:yes stop_codon:yes gene_type:complete